MTPDTERAAEAERALALVARHEVRAARWAAAVRGAATPNFVTWRDEETLYARALRLYAAVLAPSDDVLGAVGRAAMEPMTHADTRDVDWGRAALAALRECAATPADAAATERGA